MGFSVQDLWHFFKCICHMLSFLVWVSRVFFGVDFGSCNVVPVCLALLQWYFGCPVCLASFGTNFPCALFFTKLSALLKKCFLFLRHCCSVAFHCNMFQICFGGFLNIQYTSAWVWLFFFFFPFASCYHILFFPPYFLHF